MKLTKDQALRWMRATLTADPDEYLDCGEVQCTQLAEAFCEAQDWNHERIPEFVFEAASEVAGEYEDG